MQRIKEYFMLYMADKLHCCEKLFQNQNWNYLYLVYSKKLKVLGEKSGLKNCLKV